MFRSACGENRVGMGKLATRFGVLTLACIADAGQTPAQPAQALRRALADGSLSAALAAGSALPGVPGLRGCPIYLPAGGRQTFVWAPAMVGSAAEVQARVTALGLKYHKKSNGMIRSDLLEGFPLPETGSWVYVVPESIGANNRVERCMLAAAATPRKDAYVGFLPDGVEWAASGLPGVLTRQAASVLQMGISAEGQQIVREALREGCTEAAGQQPRAVCVSRVTRLGEAGFLNVPQRGGAATASGASSGGSSPASSAAAQVVQQFQALDEDARQEAMRAMLSSLEFESDREVADREVADREVATSSRG